MNDGADLDDGSFTRVVIQFEGYGVKKNRVWSGIEPLNHASTPFITNYEQNMEIVDDIIIE